VVALFSPFVGFFSEKGKQYSRDLVESLVLSALTVSYHETSRRAGREAGIKAAAITLWRQLKKAYYRYERREKKANSNSGGILFGDSTGVKTSETKRGLPLNLAIKVTGREVRGKRAVLKKELGTFSVGKWRGYELKSVDADLSVTDGDPELKGVLCHTQPRLPLQRCLFHAPRGLYWTHYRDGAKGERAYWEGRLVGELWKPSANRIAGINRPIADLGSKGLNSTATYLRNARDELFTVTRLKEQGMAPEIVMVATGPLELALQGDKRAHRNWRQVDR